MLRTTGSSKRATGNFLSYLIHTFGEWGGGGVGESSWGVGLRSGVGELASSPTFRGLKSLPSIAHFWVFFTTKTWGVGESGSGFGE